MAITFWWLGHATTTAAKVCVRGENNGTVTVACNGQNFTGTVDTAVNDGVTVVDVTGLSPNFTYPLTITDAAAATATGNLKTMPLTGGKVAFTSCWDRTRSLDDLVQNVLDFGAHAMQQQGDYIYCGVALTNYNGETTTVVNTSSTAANYANHWRQTKRKTDMRLLETSIPSYYTFDDHEFGGDNWDHSVTQAQTGLNVASGGTQAEVDNSWWVARQAAAWYHAGNPANGSALAIAEKPPAAGGAIPASNYPINYYNYRVGDIEVFAIDCISYRSILTATDNGSKTMLGANQKAWLKAALDASTAKFKIIASGKTTYFANSGGTGDDWTKYTTERDELIQYINANASGKLRGVVWIAGDAHAAFVAYDPAKRHICMCANPAGVDHLAQTAAYQTKVIWKEQGKSASNTSPQGLFGLAEAFDGYLVMRLINQFGAEQWRGRVDYGSNALLFGA